MAAMGQSLAGRKAGLKSTAAGTKETHPEAELIRLSRQVSEPKSL